MISKPIQYSAALYMRLSKDDDGQSESASITTQKKMLIAYAKENSFIIYDTYIDDGYSGTNFERPNFKRMIKDIENKKINMVITKDLSRLGRDYIMTGQYTEIFFPLKGVRYIAINDGYDSDSPYNDIAPFKNIVNEMYARDISKKIKSAFVIKMKEGSYIGNFAPYGYRKDPQNKNQLMIDGEAAGIVRKIFTMAEKGDKPKQIAQDLNKNKILPPALYRCKNKPYLNIDNYSKRKEWTAATVSKILHNIVYLGHMAQGKTNKISIKSNKTITNSKEEWIIVNNTHEAIIDEKTYDKVKKQLEIRRSNKDREITNLFTGIAKCMDCGRNMSLTGTRKKGSVANLVCGRYKLYGCKECTNHFINYESLYHIVLEELRRTVTFSIEEKSSIKIDVINKISQSSDKEQELRQKHLNTLYIKCDELDVKIQRLYEDNLSGKIKDERYQILYNTYELDQQKLKDDINRLKDEINRLKDSNRGHINEYAKESLEKKLMEQMDKYFNFDCLTRDLIFNWIDKIEVGQGIYIGTGKDRKKHQQIKIYYKYQM